MSRIYLSPPDVGITERSLLLDAFDSNWIAPVGEHVDRFEQEMAAASGVGHAVALASGTAALHLGLLLVGVGAGDDVLVPTLTFVATANAVSYVGANPVFVDSETRSWCIDPELVEHELAARTARGRRPAAVIAVDLYGQCADYEALVPICERYEVPLVEDAAEAVGAMHGSRAAGSFGAVAALSFNGNKILTTSGGGMLLADDRALTERASYLASQARDPAPHYEHSETGFNYRMSNLLAAVGRGQLRTLEHRMAARAAVHQRYRDALEGTGGIAFAPEAPWGSSNHWLTVVTLDPAEFGASPEEVACRLDSLDIEVRPAWKPMHLQPLFTGCAVVGGHVAEEAFATGLCLPSGSSLSPADQDRVIDALLASRDRYAA